jgi:hypothetical protein
MKSLIVAALLAAFALAGCVVSPGTPGYGGYEISPLPEVVELSQEPYYYYNHNWYYYHDRNWSYSREQRGPWTELPRSHWPRETIIYRDRDRGRDWDRDKDRDHDRDDRR